MSLVIDNACVYCQDGPRHRHTYTHPRPQLPSEAAPLSHRQSLKRRGGFDTTKNHSFRIES
ncbi:hypothetical protein M441DRAFT_225685 [Trichoderma asperellum CBS 433.97]|uniref:Uncharacterized protein n=1 Tax=Trichoderma asperellum (strain ATCC 204424 / CBS 433.97 / NBRC 101777) TaxID=1042311 RepID=A0A2T3ZPX1_TRIA4|nr:hypothetical protein M441DRAFT_225685 [Trichoderma asperellum CBS 433.97]PTB46845.1 hypothetical protein M441DRAFT_225685 [Trichoderma asperellum CBS 433.97]